MTMDNKEAIRWLHISDIHLVKTIETEGLYERLLNGTGDPEDEKYIRFGLAGLIEEWVPDCIVITGDFFHHGSWDRESKSTLDELLCRLYKLCSNAGAWGWEEGSRMDRLFYCPGNHDVNRHATQVSNEVLLCRENLVRDEALRMSEDRSGVFELSNQELFVFDTFRPFYTSLRSITGEGASEEDVLTSYRRHEFEARVFRIPDDDRFTRFAFVGINTSLLAGIVPSRDESLNDSAEAWEEFLSLHHAGRFDDARAKYDAYTRAMGGAFGYASDYGLLTLPSKTARDAVLHGLEDMESNPYVILFGHHPIAYLSENARKAFVSFAEHLHSKVYLCGHTHMPEGTVINQQVSEYYKSLQVTQITTGGLFPDDEHYNRISVGFGSITIDNRGKANCDSCIYTYGQDTFGTWAWTRSNRRVGQLQCLQPIASRAEARASDSLTREANSRKTTSIKWSTSLSIDKVASDLGIGSDRSPDEDKLMDERTEKDTKTSQKDAKKGTENR